MNIKDIWDEINPHQREENLHTYTSKEVQELVKQALKLQNRVVRERLDELNNSLAKIDLYLEVDLILK